MTINSGFSHKQWWFSIAMLIYQRVDGNITHDGSMVLVYMVTWIPSIYPLYVSINIPCMDPMGNEYFDGIVYIIRFAFELGKWWQQKGWRGHLPLKISFLLSSKGPPEMQSLELPAIKNRLVSGLMTEDQGVWTWSTLKKQHVWWEEYDLNVYGVLVWQNCLGQTISHARIARMWCQGFLTCAPWVFFSGF